MKISKLLSFSSAALLLFTTTAQAAQEALVLSPSTSNSLFELNALSNAIPGEPEPEWNCLNVAIGSKQLSAIMPRFLQLDEDYTHQLVELTRKLAAETVLASTGAVGAAHADGTLYGVEFKVFTNDPNPIPAPPLRMGLTADLVSGSGQTLGTLYCFTEGQFTGRITGLDINEQHIAWTGTVGHGDNLGSKAVVLFGSLNTIHGDLQANGSFGVTGTGHTIHGDLIYGSMISIDAGPHTLGTQVQMSASSLDGLPHTPTWYLANCNYYFVGNVSIQNNGSGGMVTSGGTPVSGLIYSTGSISVDGNDIDAMATFVAEGDVEFIGNGCTLLPAMDELLAYSTGAQDAEGVSIYSSNSSLTGSLVAPLKRVMVGGSKNEVYGQLQGDRVRIMGKLNTISNIYHP